MQTQVIREMIAKAIAHEQFSGSAAQALRQAAFIRGLPSTQSEIAQTVHFIRSYVEQVPELLDECAGAAAQVGIAEYALPILEAAQQYFVSPLDVIFDHFGLIGLMDDAYFSQRLLQSISDAYEVWTGNPLLPINLAPANAVIRDLIGEPQASQLDLAIESTLQQSNLQRAFHGLTGYAGTLPVSDPSSDNGGLFDLLPDSIKSMGFMSPPAIPTPLADPESAAAERPGESEDSTLMAGYQTLLGLFNQKVEAGEFTPERQRALAPVLQELGDIMKEKPQDVAGMMARVSRVRELMSRMTTAVSEPTHEGETLPADSRGGRVNQLLQGVKRYLFIEGSRSQKAEEEQKTAENLFVRCATAGTELHETGGDQAAVTAREKESFRKLALDVRNYALRHHLTLTQPIWSSPPIAQDPNTVFFSGGNSLSRALSLACDPRELTVLKGSIGLDHAQARWDYLRRSNVALFDLTVDDEIERAAVCYELGMALALGRSLIVAAKRGDKLPFDIDVMPVFMTGGDEDAEVLGNALDEVLYGQQRGGGDSSIPETVAYARRALSSEQLGFEVQLTLNLLQETQGDPIKVRYLIDSLLGFAGPEAPVPVLSAWPGDYPQPDSRRCFHIMPFSQEWSNKVMGITAMACDDSGVEYVRGDAVKDSRIIRSIWDEICRASHVIVDLTEFNANVVLELGIAHTLGRNTLIVGQEDTVGRLFPALAKLRVHEYGLEDGLDSLRSVLDGFLK